MVLKRVPAVHPVQLDPIHFGSAPVLPVVSGQEYTILTKGRLGLKAIIFKFGE